MTDKPDLNETLRTVTEMLTSIHIKDARRVWQFYRDRPPTEAELAALDERGERTEMVELPDTPTKLAALPAWVASAMELVPAEYRDAAGFCPADEEDAATVYWTRPETDDEWAARRADVERRLKLPNNQMVRVVE